MAAILNGGHFGFFRNHFLNFWMYAFIWHVIYQIEGNLKQISVIVI